jgi:hypothetical protein
VAANDASAKRARRLTALDSTFLYGESANNPLHIGSLLIFEGNIPFDDLVQHVDRRLHGSGSPKYLSIWNIRRSKRTPTFASKITSSVFN